MSLNTKEIISKLYKFENRKMFKRLNVSIINLRRKEIERKPHNSRQDMMVKQILSLRRMNFFENHINKEISAILYRRRKIFSGERKLLFIYKKKMQHLTKIRDDIVVFGEVVNRGGIRLILG